MCGLVFYKSFKKQSIVEEALMRYKAQRNRGTEGFGIFLPSVGMLYRSTTEDKILNTLKHPNAEKERYELLLHHRMPTSTPNVLNAAHPFSTGRMFKRNYVLAHNGIISNVFTLHRDHEERGIKYTSMQKDGKFNDSETLLWEMALYLEGLKEKPETMGGAAFILIESEITKTGTRPIKLHFARNSRNPLHLELSSDTLSLASEAKWESKAEEIMPNYLHTFDYRTKRLSLTPMILETFTYTNAHSWKPGATTSTTTAHAGALHTPALSPAPAANRNLYDDDYDDGYWAAYQEERRKNGEGTFIEPDDSPMEPDGGPDKVEKKTPTVRVPVLRAAEMERLADNLLSDLMDKNEDILEIERRLTSDIRRSRQAVANLNKEMEKGALKHRSFKKYKKYRQYLEVCTRALLMLQLITDPKSADVATSPTP